MRTTRIDRDTMKGIAPCLVNECEAHDAPEAPLPAYVLAWTVGPGGQTVPGPGEVDADQVRAWAERALIFQARGYPSGRRGTHRLPRRSFVIPDCVVDAILLLAKAELDDDPSPATLAPRLAAAIKSGRIPEPRFEPPVPGLRP